MSLVNFSVVLLGDNFPVQAIKVSEFSFRHRPLNESLRLPVAVQAANSYVEMQVLPDRFETRVIQPDNIEVQSEGLSEMVSTFLDYVGRRTVSAIGHNAIWRVDGSAARKRELVHKFTNADNISSILGSPLSAADIALFFNRPGTDQSRVSLITSAEGDALIDFNFHYNIKDHSSIEQIVGDLATSIEMSRKIADSVSNFNSVSAS